MHQIKKVQIKNTAELATLAKSSFLTAHGHSASKNDIDNYVADNFSEENFIKELANPNNHYYLIYYNTILAGYSKITFNTMNNCIDSKNTTYLSRLYLLKKFYGKNLGKKLFEFNIELSKKHHQKGMWLAVWIENKRAINFYSKMGFKIVGKLDFKISETHSNPNHIMHLEYY